ncbi:hypothetical protein CCY99_07005 [Helicobacter sp. 16-1353]|nr:hypothetical protein CCY99_07005 [Helicobacter sp. 16-1353]
MICQRQNAVSSKSEIHSPHLLQSPPKRSFLENEALASFPCQPPMTLLKGCASHRTKNFMKHYFSNF